MQGIPVFPLEGSAISKRVDLDRISLIVNAVGSPDFPAGQYIFYSKSHSLWYRYKQVNQSWTGEQLWLSNARESNVKFDANGYPFTTYINNEDLSLNILYYVDGSVQNQVIAPAGRFPTVLIDDVDTWVFWVPFPYTNALNYVQGCSNFSTIKPYTFTPPSEIVMMNMEYLPDKRWVFTFSCEGYPSNTIYTAYTSTE
jgi:hypothetical protein